MAARTKIARYWLDIPKHKRFSGTLDSSLSFAIPEEYSKIDLATLEVSTFTELISGHYYGTSQPTQVQLDAGGYDYGFYQSGSQLIFVCNDTTHSENEQIVVDYKTL